MLDRTLKIEKLDIGHQIVGFWPIGALLDNDGDLAVMGTGNRTTNVYWLEIGDSIPDTDLVPLGVVTTSLSGSAGAPAAVYYSIREVDP